MSRTSRKAKWTLTGAAAELGMNRNALSRRLRSIDIEPEKGGKYSLRQIVAAMTGDLNAERIAKIRVERELLELELGKTTGELLLASQLARVWSDICVSIRQVITGSNLSHTEQEAVLKQLREIDPRELSDNAESENKPR